jgi:hypothetical protein
MGKTATLLLKYRPTDSRCDEIAQHVAEQLKVPRGVVRWSLSDVIPDGYSTHLVDQLAAFKRDTPGAPIYLTVTIDSGD